MKFFYFIKDKDGCDKDFIVYEVEGSSRQVADEIFVSKFLPLLPGVLCIDFETIVNFCDSIDFELTVFSEDNLITLKDND